MKWISLIIVSNLIRRLNDARKADLCACSHLVKEGTDNIVPWYYSPLFHQRGPHEAYCNNALRRLPSPHTEDKVEEIVDKVATEWQTTRTKISAFLTDSGV